MPSGNDDFCTGTPYSVPYLCANFTKITMSLLAGASPVLARLSLIRPRDAGMKGGAATSSGLGGGDEPYGSSHGVVLKKAVRLAGRVPAMTGKFLFGHTASWRPPSAVTGRAGDGA